MRTGHAADIIIGLAFAALGAGIIIIASGFRTIAGMVVGSGLFPAMTGTAMIFFGGLMAIGAARAARGSMPASAAGAREPLFDRYAIAIVSALALLTVVTPPAGFLAGGFVFSVFAIRLGGGRWTGAILFSAIATAGIYLIFTQGLRVPLPRGPF